jgi:prolyl oligopeptidase
MKNIIIFSLLILFMISCKDSADPKMQFENIPVTYTESRMDSSVVEDYHGTEIADPFRWLEDDNSEETVDWVKRQNAVTFDYLDKIPFREELKTRLEEIWDYEKYSSPFKEGDKYYYFKNDGLQNQSVLYVTNDIKEDGEVFLDPNTFSDDGTVALSGLAFNKDGSYLAYMVSEGGSDWNTAYVMNTETGELMDDKLEWIKFSGLSWSKDGFFYSRYPAPDGGDELSAKNEFHQLFYHKIGTDQSKDRKVYEDLDNPQRNVYATATEDEKYLLITMVESTSGNEMAFIDLTQSAWKPVKVKEGFDSDLSFIDNNGDKLLFQTNIDAPKNKIIAIDAKNPKQDNWEEIVPESEDALRGVSIMGGKMWVNYIHNASSLIKVYDLDGKYISDLELPGIGTVGGVSGKKKDDTGFFTFTSFTVPSTIYALNADDMSYEIFRQPNVDFKSEDFETKQVWYTSKDGTKVPMFLTMKKGLKQDGSNPTLLYGYGGFDIPVLPGFSLTRLPLLENGGIYVVANIRGGGEFGKEWHKAGTLERKQNVFDDFIAAAEHLIAEKYTSSDKLAIEGGSNGGLLVGACMTQRPDLFAVAYPRVGVLDMLRYHEFTIGWAWASDYGRSDDPEAFKYLIEYSPLHNVDEAAYPATMVMTADHDDRVVPAHSFKFAAELQRKHNGDNPVLIRIETSAGHGAGKPTSKQIEEAADALAFMFYNMKEPYLMEVKG